MQKMYLTDRFFLLQLTPPPKKNPKRNAADTQVKAYPSLCTILPEVLFYGNSMILCLQAIGEEKEYLFCRGNDPATYNLNKTLLGYLHSGTREAKHTALKEIKPPVSKILRDL